MLLEIDIFGFGVLIDLIVPVENGASRRLPGGAVLHLPEAPPPFSATPGKPATVTFNLECGSGVETRVTGNWLAQTFKGRVEQLRIAGAVVALDRDSIVAALDARRGR